MAEILHFLEHLVYVLLLHHLSVAGDRPEVGNYKVGNINPY